jgi:hypothetical protein
VARDESFFARRQEAVGFVNHCPRCALGRQAWLEVQGDHFTFNALAVGAPFLAILLLTAGIEVVYRWQGGRKHTRPNSHEAAE